MDRPTDAHEWSAYYQQQTAKLEAARNRAEHAAPKEPPKYDIHPLVLRRDNLHHEQVAARVVGERQEAQRREAERLAAPHPFTQAPFVHIPIPERKQQPKQKPAEPVLTPAQQALVRERQRSRTD
jgi:hypothetical protein